MAQAHLKEKMQVLFVATAPQTALSIIGATPQEAAGLHPTPNIVITVRLAHGALQTLIMMAGTTLVILTATMPAILQAGSATAGTIMASAVLLASREQ